MFTISWRGSGGGGRCQNRQEEQHTLRFGLECASFMRVGAADKAMNSYEIWTTVDTNFYEIRQEEVSNVQSAPIFFLSPKLRAALFLEFLSP
jgi:hypothetical protein